MRLGFRLGMEGLFLLKEDPRGVLRFGLDGGVPIKPQNPLPIFLGSLWQKQVPILGDFS